MDGIFLVSEQYTNADDLRNKIQIVTKNLKSNYAEYGNEFPINIVIRNEDIDKQIELYIRDSAGFNRSYNNLYGINNYGILMEIDYNKDEKLIVPFLREMLNEMPELLVYDEETPKGIDCYVYNKQFFDNNQGNDYYAIMDKNPPKNLNDLA